ncbi:MAG: M56 family metallopeptidase [Verrucomicrobiales bacterium]|nr:M56 family metallopeptidase [Verrucomicrobiales bacterium]
MKTWWLDLAMVSTGTLAVTWALTVMLRRQSAAWRHLVWRLGFVATAAAWALLVSSWRVELPWLAARATVAVVAEVDAVATVTVSEVTPTVPLALTPARAVDWWLVIWLSGAALCLLPLTAGWWRVRRLLRNARPFADGRRVLVSADVAVPLTVGVCSPKIVLPTSVSAWPAERVRRVLAHEAAHGQRRDVAWALLARVVCALCWFNPLAWFAAHRQRVEAELACDDAVINSGAAADDYATDLLQILRACPRGLPSPLMAGMAARPSQIRARLAALLAADADRAAVKRGAARALTVGVLLAVAALTVVRVTRATETKSADHDRQTSPSAQADKPEGKLVYFGAKLLNVPKDAPVLQSAEFKKAWAAADVNKILALISGVENTDLIASPSMEVKFGTRAKIHVPREFRYPDAWDENSQPIHFTQKDVGLTIEVLNDWKDGKIVLDVNLKLTELEGFINYPAAQDKTSGAEDNAKRLSRPVFREREKSLSCALADGESLVEWMPDTTLTTGGREFSKDTRTALLLTARLVEEPPPTVSVAERLQRIVIPKVKFTDAEVGEVLNYLQEQSKLHDPLKVGVNIVFKAEPTNASPDWQGGGNLTLDLVEVSLGKILDLIRTLTLYKYEVTEQAVYVLPNIETSEVMLVRVFVVPENFFPEPRTIPEGKGISPEDADVRKELVAKGIEFLAGASAAYLPKIKKLVVRNTAGQLAKITELIARPGVQPPTVSVAERLQRIVIPKVKFTDAEVGEVLSYLQAQSKLHDPLKVGVNMVFKAEPTNASPDWHSGKKITLDLVEVSLGKILDFMQTLVPYKYKVEEQAIYVFPNIETSEVMLVRVFTVPENLHAALADGDARQNLMARGIEFAKGATATYMPKIKKLAVRNTLEQLNKITALLGSPPLPAPKAADGQAASPSAAGGKMVEYSAKFFYLAKETTAVQSENSEMQIGADAEQMVRTQEQAGAKIIAEKKATAPFGQMAKGLYSHGYVAEAQAEFQDGKIALQLGLQSAILRGYVMGYVKTIDDLTSEMKKPELITSSVSLLDGQSVLFWFPKKDDDAGKAGAVLTVRLVDKQD